MTDFAPPYEIIAKACDGRDSASVQVRLGDASKIGDEEALRDAVSSMFEEQFGHAPARVGVVVLPWVEEEEEA